MAETWLFLALIFSPATGQVEEMVLDSGSYEDCQELKRWHEPAIRSSEREPQMRVRFACVPQTAE
jgi:hypothetical protein